MAEISIILKRNSKTVFDKGDVGLGFIILRSWWPTVVVGGVWPRIDRRYYFMSYIYNIEARCEPP